MRVFDGNGRTLRNSTVLIQLFSRGSIANHGAYPGDDEAALGPVLRGGAPGDLLARTDANGIVVADYFPQPPFGGRPVLLVEQDVGGAAHAASSVDVPETWSAGTHDIGDVHLSWVPLVVAGRTIDDRGMPVANARIEIYAPSGAPRLRGVSDADGHYAIRGFAFESELRLGASRDRHLLGWRAKVARGSSNVDVVLPLACEVRGKLAMSARRSASDYSVDVRPTDPTRGGGDTVPHRARLDRDGSFRIRDVPPGTYRLVVARSPQGFTVISKDAVMLTRGEELDLGTMEVVASERR